MDHGYNDAFGLVQYGIYPFEGTRACTQPHAQGRLLKSTQVHDFSFYYLSIQILSFKINNKL